ncbi:MAG: spermidine/putrescine ABC transporter substrate-binding protein [Oscillospiraceae bacterium]|jgi:spermidine/putrescine-binding protein|nr:spermidine/putrescine ABC transporter substrate-binding protein [Oscillospiraceae bacterium]
MKKVIAIVLCAVLLAVTAAGCSKSKSGPVAEISVFIWSEYLPQSVVDGFTEKYNVKVNVETFSSIADMYAKVKSAPSGTYDVIDAADFYIQRLSGEGFLEQLDYANIPNSVNIEPGYLARYFDPENLYSVPYLGGVATLCVNTDKVTKPITSYADIFDPEFANSIVIIDDFRVIIGAINVMLGFDYNETDPAKLAQTEAKLMELKPNIKLLDSDSPKTAMINGETTIGLIYSAEIAIAMDEVPAIEVVFPTEGQYLFFDSLCVAKGSKNKEWSEKFINYILDPEVSKGIVEVFPYTDPNKAAVALMDKAYLDNAAKNIPAEAIAKGLTPTDLEADTLQIYNDIWTKFTK